MKIKLPNMTDEQFNQMTDEEKRTFIAEELKKNRAREQELIKVSRELTKPGKYSR